MTDDVFDLDAVLAEASDVDPFRFRFGGETYEIPAHDMDVRILAIADTGRYDDALRLLIGADRWAEMAQSDQMIGVKLCERLFEAYLDHVEKAQGVPAGKSSRSGGSSKSTAERSKRTSPGTTPARG